MGRHSLPDDFATRPNRDSSPPRRRRTVVIATMLVLAVAAGTAVAAQAQLPVHAGRRDETEHRREPGRSAVHDTAQRGRRAAHPGEARLQGDRRDDRAGAGHIGRRQGSPAVRHFIRRSTVHRGRPGDARHVDDHGAERTADPGSRCLRFHGHDRSGTQSVPDGCHQGLVDPGPRPVHAERRDRSAGVRHHARRRQGLPPAGADRPSRRPREGRRHPSREARRGLLRAPAGSVRRDGPVRHHAGCLQGGTVGLCEGEVRRRRDPHRRRRTRTTAPSPAAP